MTSLANRPGKAFTAAALVLAASLISTGGSQAAEIPIPNGSFESPTPPPGFPASPQVDNWQKPPQPAWFDPASSGITWDQLSGVFPNTPAGSADHIDNVDGNQAAYMIALPQVSLSQDLNASFETGMAYTLRVGVLAGGGITEGSSFEVGLYYRDESNAPVTVAATPLVYSAAEFPNATHLIEYEVGVPIVQAGDPWAEESIGVHLTSTFGSGAGYWDLDNVRLEAVPEPSTAALAAILCAAFLAAGFRRRARAAGRRNRPASAL